MTTFLQVPHMLETRLPMALGFLLCNAIVFLSFLVLYKNMDMKHHFDVEPTLENATYFTAVTHTTVGFGDITPKTQHAKNAVLLHISIVWTLFALVIFFR